MYRLWVEEKGFRAHAFGCGVKGLGLRVWGLGFRVQGLGFRDQI